MLNGTRYLSIGTDASLKDGIMGYAIWITADTPIGTIRVQFTGNGEATDSNHAEMQAIIDALKYVLVNEYVQDVDVIVINTDSMNAKRAFERVHRGDIVYYNDSVKHYEKLHKLLNKTVVIKHVKGHSKSSDSRKYVNNWADKAARQSRLNYKPILNT